MLNRPLTGELGIRKVLLDEVAELGVKTLPKAIWLLEDEPEPKMEPAGVEG